VNYLSPFFVQNNGSEGDIFDKYPTAENRNLAKTLGVWRYSVGKHQRHRLLFIQKVNQTMPQ
jgi:hypothetical protein